MLSDACTMVLEEKIEVYKALRKEIEELEMKKKILGAEILSMMPSDTKTLIVASHVVKRYSRLSIRTSLENARLIGASKMEEVVDKDKIKDLFALGQSIPGVTEYKYIQVYSLKSNDN